MVSRIQLLETKTMLVQDATLVIFQFKVMISKTLMSDCKPHVISNVILELQDMLEDDQDQDQ